MLLGEPPTYCLPIIAFHFKYFLDWLAAVLNIYYHPSSCKILSVQLGFHGAFLERELVDKNGPTACVQPEFNV